jgi:hypothetical protein
MKFYGVQSTYEGDTVKPEFVLIQQRHDGANVG